LSSPASAGEGDHRAAMVEGATPLDRDRALILALDRLPHTIEQAIAKRAPNILCAFAFELAQSFSRFHAAHHILSEPESLLSLQRIDVLVRAGMISVRALP
jgi:arginyl-tRNA synthetase